MDFNSVQEGFEQGKEIAFSDVHQICAQHAIEIKSLKSITGSFDKQIFFINAEYLLRVSGETMALEQEKFRRVAALDHVPKILHSGVLEREADAVYYTLLTLLPGDDFVNVYEETTLEQQIQLGNDVARFLDNLNTLTGTYYDIGLYVPALPNFAGTWRDGHQKYWELLEYGVQALQLQPESVQIFEQAFQYLDAAIDVLDYQTGSQLLHNDFHPRNILLDQGGFSGVIDWECSQYSEADFELCHLIHWCKYPPQPHIDFRPFLRSLMQSAPKCTQIPNLGERLTIYQIEHEIQQIIWHREEAASWRIPRLQDWLTGGVDDLLREIL